MLLAEGDTLAARSFPGRWRRARSSRRASSCRPAASISNSWNATSSCRRSTRTGGNQTRAAALLGLNRDQIRYRIEKFGLKV